MQRNRARALLGVQHNWDGGHFSGFIAGWFTDRLRSDYVGSGFFGLAEVGTGHRNPHAGAPDLQPAYYVRNLSRALLDGVPATRRRNPSGRHDLLGFYRFYERRCVGWG